MDNDEARSRERLHSALKHVEADQKAREAAGVHDGEYRVIVVCEGCQGRFRLPGNEIWSHARDGVIFLSVDGREKSCRCPHCGRYYIATWVLHTDQAEQIRLVTDLAPIAAAKVEASVGMPSNEAFGRNGRVTLRKQ